MLQGDDLDHGRNGYYLAASGSVVWDNLYAAIAKALAKRGIIDDESIHMADDHILEKMGAAIGYAKEFVPIQLGAKYALILLIYFPRTAYIYSTGALLLPNMASKLDGNHNIHRSIFWQMQMRRWKGYLSTSNRFPRVIR
jgi:hypothetical protein